MDIQKTENYELIVRKKISAFLEKLLRFCGYDFRHDLYKQIIYSETSAQTPLEDTIKNLYDAYWFLLSNHKRPLSQEILKRFFYIVYGRETDESLLIRLSTKFFYLGDLAPIEKAIEYHLYVYTELYKNDDDNSLIIPLMFFNYVLVASGIPTLRFISPTLKQYLDCRKKYFDGDKKPIYQLFLDQLSEGKCQNKSFYKNLTPITTQDIYTKLINDKDILKNRYGIQSVYIFGSFAKDLQRIDSDIDLLIVFSPDFSYEKKMQIVDYLANHYFNVFNRYIDFTEISEYISDDIIKEITNYIKIY